VKTPVRLNVYLRGAPAAPCSRYDANDTVVCIAKREAKNRFPLKCAVSAVALETDGEEYRFPPNEQQLVCDWCVFSEEGLRGCFIELKGSRYEHALDQLKSTMTYMSSRYSVVPQRAIVVLSGAHPANSRPGKASAKAKFKTAFPGVVLCERSRDQPKPDDVLK